ncbi:MAG: hypothetical protein JRG91_17610 [Deltaproteobacteria bacterium]|nr:hypothetical protein [Deltaproteobacteria bacterium]
MRVLPFLALVACNPPPTHLGDAQILTTATLEAHLGTHVTVTGTPTPTRVVEHGPPSRTCRLFYMLGNRKLFVDDCSGAEQTSPFTGRLVLFSTLPKAAELAAYFRDQFGIKVVPSTTYVIVTDS